MTAQLAVGALRAAVARRAPTSVVIVHSDRGSQFRARSFRAVLTAAGLQGSMGRVASAGDNAAMESFNSLLRRNVLDRRRWRTRDELHSAVVHWVEHTYNNRRRQRSLGKLTPVEYELAFTRHAATAARSNLNSDNQTCSRPDGRGRTLPGRGSRRAAGGVDRRCHPRRRRSRDRRPRDRGRDRSAGRAAGRGWTRCARRGRAGASPGAVAASPVTVMAVLPSVVSAISWGSGRRASSVSTRVHRRASDEGVGLLGLDPTDRLGAALQGCEGVGPGGVTGVEL